MLCLISFLITELFLSCKSQPHKKSANSSQAVNKVDSIDGGKKQYDSTLISGETYSTEPAIPDGFFLTVL
jgi:hypothetical protein